MEKATAKGIIHSSSRKPDMVVKEVPIMETPTNGTGTTTESLGEMTVMKEPQMIMIQILMMRWRDGTPSDGTPSDRTPSDRTPRRQ